jgi:hypothetical protein
VPCPLVPHRHRATQLVFGRTNLPPFLRRRWTKLTWSNCVPAPLTRHAQLLQTVVTTVLNAAASGFMTRDQAHASEQVNAVRLLTQCSPEQCSWAADAVGYLLEAGRFADIYRYYSGK